MVVGRIHSMVRTGVIPIRPNGQSSVGRMGSDTRLQSMRDETDQRRFLVVIGESADRLTDDPDA
jgi:hypothetical protein